jgi:hypothetical protein
VHKPHSHNGEINYITEILMLNGEYKLITCSDDGMLKIWNTSSSPHNLILETVIQAHNDKIYQVISLSNELILSCSDDNTIRLWNAVLAQRMHFPYENQKQPRALLALTHRTNTFAVSCCGGKGYITMYSSVPPYEQQGVAVNEVYTRWSHGMIELSNGHVVLSQRKCVHVVDLMLGVICADIRCDRVIHPFMSGSLCKVGDIGFVYVCRGNMMQVRMENGNYEVIFVKEGDGREMCGDGGVVVVGSDGEGEDGDRRWFMLVDRMSEGGVTNYGVNVFKMEYN